MTKMQAAGVRDIVVETLAEQRRASRDDIDAVVLKAVATTLTSFGIDEDEQGISCGSSALAALP